MEKHFESKSLEYLPILFAGMKMKNNNDEFFMEQETQIKDTENLQTSTTSEEFRTTRHKIACLSDTSLEILSGVDILEQVTKDTFQNDDIQIAKK